MVLSAISNTSADPNAPAADAESRPALGMAASHNGSAVVPEKPTALAAASARIRRTDALAGGCDGGTSLTARLWTRAG